MRMLLAQKTPSSQQPVQCTTPLYIQAIPANTPFHFAPQPNCRFNADANISHAFGIFMAYVGALQPSASGAG